MATAIAKPAESAKSTKTVVQTGPRLRIQYNTRIVKELQAELGLKNVHQVPRLEKIVVNSGLGQAKDDKKLMETATNTLRKITGQQPVQTAAKVSVASFKLREGNKIGLKVTLRGDRMYRFGAALPAWCCRAARLPWHPRQGL